MGFSFNFFGEQSHRVFNYKPRYYDPEAEERKQFFSKGKAELEADRAKKGEAVHSDEEYRPGKYISGSFRSGNYQTTKPGSGSKAQKIIGMIGLGLFFVSLIFLAMNYGKLMDAMDKKNAEKAYIQEEPEQDIAPELLEGVLEQE